MNRTVRVSAMVGWACALATVVLGCANISAPNPRAKKAPASQKERKQEVVRQFDENRDRAEFEAAAASWERGDLKACEGTLRGLLERNPAHRDARLLMADVCLAGNRSPEALVHIRQALQDHPNDAQVQYAMGLLLDATNQRGEALAYYERAAKWEADNEVYAVGYHTALEAARKPGAAGPAATLPRPKPPQDRPEGTAADGAGSAGVAGREPDQDLLQRGYAALQQNAPEVALVYFREAAAFRPNNPHILISASTAALRHNYPDLAIELIVPAEKRLSDSAAVKRILGAAYYRLGDYRSSQVALQQALSLDKSSALAYFLMGCTLARLGQAESAETHFRQAQALDSRYTVRR